MKSFKDYLAESVKTYSFKIKIAGDVTSEDEGTLKTALEQFSVAEFKKVGKTPIQSLPLDFPKVRNTEVSIYEVTTNYPATPQVLTDKVAMCLKRPFENVVVRTPNDPLEEYQQAKEKREGALLDDPDYKETTNADINNYYGEKYNTSFLKTLNDDANARRKARGEVIPEGDQPEMKNKDADSKSVFNAVAPDPRKK